MIKATEEYEDLCILLSVDEDEAEEIIIKSYLVIRLKPLIGTAGINENRLNNIIDMITDLYFDEGYSLDIIVNAIYNYINDKKTCPSNNLLCDNIETLLKEYAE